MQTGRRDILRLIATAPWLGLVFPVPVCATEQRLQAFTLSDVRLRAGPYRHAQELDGRYLRSLDPDRLLHNFRVNAGLPAKAPFRSTTCSHSKPCSSNALAWAAGSAL